MMETIVYTFCAYLPIHLLAYLPFVDLLRFGKRWMVTTVAGNILLHLLGVAWVIHIGRPDLVMVMGFAMVPVSLALYFLNIRLSLGKLLFTYVLLVNYQNIALGIAAFLAARLFHAGPRSLESGVLCLALCALACLPMYRLFRYAAQQVYRIDAPKLWRVIWLLPAVTSGIVTVFTGSLQEELVGSWQFLLARTSLLLCVVLVYWVLLNALDGIKKQAVLQEQLNFETHLLELQMEEEEKRSLLLMETAEQTRQMRHDLRHHLTAIQAMAGEENSKLRDYIATLILDIPTAVRDYCENPTVNAVVSHYAARCRQEGIAFTARLTVPAQNENLDDRALCVVFANLLENGVEACGRMTGGEKFIQINSSLEYGVLTITMDNSFDGQARQENGKFLSSKRAGAPGVGLSSIRAVAKAHQGDARFEAKGTTFLSSVYCRL
ncbi:signal transduction histidine kinase [Catenibacillus scindens]|uniref:Signal transduction histidine kinase n=1 Tax=Catenibacillus scindens TaxID=673271 RepID=A0A7W8HD14_9FIRM|nr:GHKL domain-containing protein [Catenibacillus scindens]MBB5266204.1 signal transduction histidine kinase [Catenibacillus scindens]